MLVKRVWIDQIEADTTNTAEGCADVMIEMVNGELWLAHFVTLPYLQQQMQFSLTLADKQNGLGKVGYVALETPHVIVDKLEMEIIEDIVDNLLIMGTFEAVFDLVTDSMGQTIP